MRIVIDANEANVQNRVGSNTYAFELLRSLEKLTRNKPEHQFTLVLTAEPLPDWPPARDGWQYHVIANARLFTQWSFPIYLFKNHRNFDLVYTPGHYGPRLSPIPSIVSVMDLAFLHYPKQFRLKDLIQLKWWTSYSIKRAKHVIAISEFTKDDLIKSYKLNPEKISVVYPGINPLEGYNRSNKTTDQKKLKSLGVTQDFILYVGTFQPRKNLVRLVSAYEKLMLKLASEMKTKKRIKKGSRLAPLQLVLAGKTGWLADPILKRIENSPYRQQIVLPGFVTEEQKQILYKNASSLALVGLYEGFGMPALEAMQFQVIPVVSKSSSLPEVVGEGGILVSPENVISIMRGLDRSLNMTKKERQKLLQASKKQLGKYTWENSAEKLIKVFEEVK